jgi:hypothetical protein
VQGKIEGNHTERLNQVKHLRSENKSPGQVLKALQSTVETSPISGVPPSASTTAVVPVINSAGGTTEQQTILYNQEQIENFILNIIMMLQAGFTDKELAEALFTEYHLSQAMTTKILFNAYNRGFPNSLPPNSWPIDVQNAINTVYKNNTSTAMLLREAGVPIFEIRNYFSNYLRSEATPEQVIAHYQSYLQANFSPEVIYMETVLMYNSDQNSIWWDIPFVKAMKRGGLSAEMVAKLINPSLGSAASTSKLLKEAGYSASEVMNAISKL